ncbi:hypothetical protein EB796_005016 [Bugula neritina]|uniref:Uncharacterized protein n=1 Tax=Bugula neritina TaxID=10212 RepID=A0A7J7KFL3_BUGNE|nr:hypothetical protein EB796_005016 [Bugula neritina]
MEWIYIKIIFICTIYTIVQECTAFTTMNMDIYICQNGYIPPSKCFHEFSVMHVRSVSLQFKDSAVNVSDRSTRCHREVKVQRKIINILDQALTPQYRYIYRWARHKCQGRRECLPGRLPRWDQIQGDGTAEGKYFSGIRVDAVCDTIPVPTEEAPVSTTTTSTTTTARAAAISFYILTPQLTHIERIMLGVSLGLAISILLVTLLLLYHWDTMRRKKRLLEILDDIGRPHEEHDWYVDELVEEQKYSQMDSIKPDEIMTLDKYHCFAQNRLYLKTTERILHNFCTTISRNNSVRSNGSRGSGWRSSGRRSNRGYTNDAFHLY